MGTCTSRRSRSPLGLAIAVAAVLHAGTASSSGDLEDLHYGEILYHAHQGHYFEALERLDAEIAQHYRVDEPWLDSLNRYIDDANFKVGDFELHYRMHRRAGRAIERVLAANVEDAIRNDAALRLARLQFQKSQTAEAFRSLEQIEGDVPESIRDDMEFLRANLYLAANRPSDAAEVLRSLQDSESFKGFVSYNLGVALLRENHLPEAIAELDRAGTVPGGSRAILAIRDKANLLLGTLLLEASEFETAQSSLERVRLEGPFSNQALLRAGWAGASAGRFDRAVVPWGILAEREATDAAVQESLLALPYAYSQLEVHGRAALLYRRAAEVFAEELDKVDASIDSIRSGAFLGALNRDEILRDRDWAVRLRGLPDAPETFYLLELIASHDFQNALQNYLDLADLERRLISWNRTLDALEDVTRLRRDYYQPLLPEVDREFRQLDARMRLRLQQRQHLSQRLEGMLTAPRPEYLATASERELASQLGELETALSRAEDPGALGERISRLKGLLTWTLETEYHERLTEAHKHLRELDEQVEALNAQYEAFVRTRQAATHSYEGYGGPIDGLRGRVAEGLEQVKLLMARQGHLLETVAIRELVERRARLETYQNEARFAFADSYDRAAKAQAGGQ